MLRAWIRDALERLTRLVQPWDCCLLLLFHRDNNDIVRGNLDHIKHDCIAPEIMVKVKCDPGSIFSILQMMVEDLKSTAWILQVNNWFHCWFNNKDSAFAIMGPPLRTKDCLEEVGLT